MKKSTLYIVGVLILSLTIINCGRDDPYTKSHGIKEMARQASVQPIFDIPVMKASFVKPLEKETSLSREEINEMLQEKIKEAIEVERELQKIDKYNTYLTTFTTYGFKSPSTTDVPIGAMTPRWAKFPENVLVVYKVEKKSITAWEKEFEQDILTISETANVSPSQAKNIISKLKQDGYSLYKETIDQSSDVELLWFQNGWDLHPTRLNWKVYIEGTERNIITGYNSIGILKVQSIPTDVRVNITAGYFDLKDEFKPKSSQVESLEKEIERLEENLKKLEKELLDEQKKKEEKRDITTATRFDVLLGKVKLEVFYMKSAASGIFLGNMKVAKDFQGYHSSWGMESHDLYSEFKGVILTNAHVATAAQDYYMMVSKDKEVMYFIFPANSYIRYTQDSDIKGTPAQLLFYDGSPVLSWDYDCAIMVTTAIPQYEKHKAVLGNSDKIQEGDPVIMVGNPIFMQKFLTSGVVSNTSYNLMKSGYGDEILKKGLSQKQYNWLVNSNFWFDTPIGIGGTSGSGVWAVGGSEKGKVIALHNMGMAQKTSVMGDTYTFSKVDIEMFLNIVTDDGRLQDILKKYSKFLFNRDKVNDIDEIVQEDKIFTELLQKHSHIDIAGMNAGIPINRVKQYLQERGLNPSNFGWEGLDQKYWVR